MTASITVAELHNRPADAQLIDVRSPCEFAAGHIPGAVKIPVGQIESRLDELSPTKPIVLICQLGKRARLTAGLLEPCRLELSVLGGGTRAWIRAGFPVVVSSRSGWSLERQARLGAGLLVLSAAALSLSVNVNWVFLAALVGAGLTFAGLTEMVPSGELLQRLPWNKAAPYRTGASQPKLRRSCQ